MELTAGSQPELTAATRPITTTSEKSVNAAVDHFGPVVADAECAAATTSSAASAGTANNVRTRLIFPPTTGTEISTHRGQKYGGPADHLNGITRTDTGELLRWRSSESQCATLHGSAT
jgi:hypothetical protein